MRRMIGRPQTEPVLAIDGIDLRIDRGQFFSLLGPNGAGKTTMVRILCTLLLPDGGSCRVAGYDVVGDPRAVRRSIGVSIRGERSVYWKLTGRQNLDYFASLYGLSRAVSSSRIEEVAEIVGLADRMDDYVENYSMGMKQRLAIGVSLVHRPPVLLLDEPTIGLDPNGAHALRSLLKELCEQQGVTILYTTHYMPEAEELSDRLAIINFGKTVIEGAPSQVRESLGDNRIVEVQVGGDPTGVGTALRTNPLVEEVLAEDQQPTFTTFRVRTREPLASVGQLLAADGIANAEIRSINLVRPTLEDVFVSLTGSTIGTTGDVETV